MTFVSRKCHVAVLCRLTTTTMRSIAYLYGTLTGVMVIVDGSRNEKQK